LAPPEAEQHSRQRCVLASGQLRQESDLKAQQRRSYSGRTLDGSAIASENSGEHAQERRLAGAVSSDNAERLAGLDVERYAPKRPAVAAPSREDTAAQEIADADVAHAKEPADGGHAGNLG